MIFTITWAYYLDSGIFLADLENRYFSNMTLRPQKSENRVPGYPKSIRKGVKKQLKSHPENEKREKVKSNENHCIYNGFSTSGHQLSTTFPLRNWIKSHLEIDAGIWSSQTGAKWAKCSKTGPKWVPKFIRTRSKSKPGSSDALFADPRDTWFLKMSIQGSWNELPGWKEIIRNQRIETLDT